MSELSLEQRLEILSDRVSVQSAALDALILVCPDRNEALAFFDENVAMIRSADRIAGIMGDHSQVRGRHLEDSIQYLRASFEGP